MHSMHRFRNCSNIRAWPAVCWSRRAMKAQWRRRSCGLSRNARLPRKKWTICWLPWRIAKFVKSNAIVCVKDRTTVGIGAGQMSRVVSSKIAAMKAADEGLSLDSAAMASDAFFPFRDGLDVCAQFGIKSVIQPGGSKRDADVIAAADEHGIAMVFTGMRHFRH